MFYFAERDEKKPPDTIGWEKRNHQDTLVVTPSTIELQSLTHSANHIVYIPGLFI